jgi:hypothetical protein
LVGQLNRLIKQINRTNAQTAFDAGRTITDALADRDMLTTEQGVLGVLLNAAVGQATRNAYNASPIKYFRTVDVGAIQKRIDALAQQRRDLDARIQASNWTVDLIE